MILHKSKPPCLGYSQLLVVNPAHSCSSGSLVKLKVAISIVEEGSRSGSDQATIPDKFVREYALDLATLPNHRLVFIPTTIHVFLQMIQSQP